ncbi:transposase IS4 domain-containing protein [Ditylenchus destructor]|uniref:Transposase IS4 domain-containing protein n=1 Tax=Ditylenchus destructor TaxID=166010 RepID=A0AAD4MPC5_9BILA|nr:transposase IS4 domain-containing protein [Ditylenchus destructor]
MENSPESFAGYLPEDFQIPSALAHLKTILFQDPRIPKNESGSQNEAASSSSSSTTSNSQTLEPLTKRSAPAQETLKAQILHANQELDEILKKESLTDIDAKRLLELRESVLKNEKQLRRLQCLQLAARKYRSIHQVNPMPSTSSRFLNGFSREPRIFRNMSHFRKTMNVEQALEYLEELDMDDAIVGADVFLEPPTNENLSDEDSADEDVDGDMDNFNRNQLLANAELRVQAAEGHQDDLFEEDYAAAMDVSTPGSVTYPPLPAQLKWSKHGSFADLHAGDIDNAHLDQLTYHTPVQMFELFFSDDLYNMMKVQSELYAISLHKKFTVRIDELKAFVGIMLLSGYIDLPNWRMMLNLVHQLKMRNIGYTGTIQHNRLKDCPLDHKQKRNSKNGLEQGSYDWAFETKTDILACLWIDNGPVYMLSTVDAVEPIKIMERWSAKEKERSLVTQPNLVHQYNTVMCGVDQMDQNISRYRTGIRSKKWWFSIFSFCLDTSVQNAWQIYRIYNPNVTLLEFRRQIVQYYLHAYKQAPKRSSFQPQSRGKKPRVSEDIRYDRRDHWIVINETRIRCAECNSQTTRKCEKCGVGLHDQCFKAYHVVS